MMAGTFVDGEQLEKGGKKELEPGKSVVTIGRCEMTITLLRTKPVKSKDRRGDPRRQSSVLYLCEHKDAIYMLSSLISQPDTAVP